MDPLAIKLFLDNEGATLHLLHRIFDLLGRPLAKHWRKRTEQLNSFVLKDHMSLASEGSEDKTDLVVQTTMRVIQLPRHLLEVRAGVEQVISVGVKDTEHGVLLHGNDHIYDIMSICGSEWLHASCNLPLRMMRTIHLCSSGVDLLYMRCRILD